MAKSTTVAKEIEQGRIWLLGHDQPVELDPTGNAWTDLAGHILHFHNPQPKPGSTDGSADFDVDTTQSEAEAKAEAETECPKDDEDPS